MESANQERQFNELEVIKSIFPDQFEAVPNDEDWNAKNGKVWSKPWIKFNCFRLTLHPVSAGSSSVGFMFDRQNAPVFVVVEFRLPDTYPEKSVPLMDIVESKGLSADQVKQLLKILREKAQDLVGSEIIYELASIAKEFLSSQGRVSGDKQFESLHDAMLERDRIQSDLRQVELTKLEKEKEILEMNAKLDFNLQINEELEAKKARKLHRLKNQDNRPNISSSVMPSPFIDTNSNWNPYEIAQQMPQSRYQADFIEIEFLGRGSYGEVVKVQNRLDGQLYAIKKLKLHSKDTEYNKRTIREVTTLSRLHNTYVVRYYQAWLEGNHEIESEKMESPIMSPAIDMMNASIYSDADFMAFAQQGTSSSSSIEFVDRSWADVARQSSTTQDSNAAEIPNIYAILYIQMEYCEKNTLKDVIASGITVDESWKIFRQIVEGLSYIHSQGMIHRDLKPTNIFIDSNGDVKIGDFGLATSLEYSDPIDNKNDIKSADGNLTTAVGTSLYMAPEILRSNMYHYDQKVDVYSLGIIFFECIHSFKTEMERIAVLNNLRMETVTFPADFDNAKLEKHKIIINLLLHHDPGKRPTSSEILQSDFLPTDKLEEALRTIINPSAYYYTKLLDSLFSQNVHAQKDFTYEYNSGNTGFDTVYSSVFSRSRTVIEDVLKSHGGMEIQTPVLMPKSHFNDSKPGIVRMMDIDGMICELPYDLTVSFARKIARSKLSISVLKRWTFGEVFRQNIYGGQPKAIMELDYDIVHSSHSESIAYNCEVIKVVAEVLEALPGLNFANYQIRLNHAKIIDMMFEKCFIPVDKQTAIGEFISQNSTKFNWPKISVHLENVLSISKSSIELLDGFLQKNYSLDDTDFEKFMSTFKKGKDLFAELKAHLTLLRSSGISCQIFFDPKLMYNYKIYRNGLIFEVFLGNNRKHETIAAGGRYDLLLKHFSGPTVSKGALLGVGVNIAFAKICSIIHSQYTTSANLQGSLSESPYDVLIASVGKIDLKYRFSLCAEFWKARVKADFIVPNDLYSVEDLTHICRRRKIFCLVLLKEHLQAKQNGVVKVKFIPFHRETDIPKENVIELVKSQLKEFKKVDRHSSISLESIKPSFHEGTGSFKRNVNVFVYDSSKPSFKGKSPKQHSTVYEKAIKSFNVFLEKSGLKLSASTTVSIIAVDMRINMIKNIISTEIWSDDNFKRNVLDSYPKQRDYLLSWRKFIADFKQETNNKIRTIFIYSYIEDHWELLHI